MRVAGALLVAAAGVAWLYGASDGRPESVPAGGDPSMRVAAPAPRDDDRPSLRGAAGRAPAPDRAARWTVAGVVRRDGRPAAARITAFAALEGTPSPSALAGETSSDAAKGEFTLPLDPPPEATGVWLVADAEGARGTRFVDLRYSRVARHHVLDLDGGGETLAGRVVDGEGRPWQGPLYLRAAGEDSLPPAVLRRGRSGPDGAFAFTGLPGGVACVGADLGEGRVVQGPTVRLPTSEAYRLVASLGGEPLRVRVLRKGDASPVAGAHVSIHVGRTLVAWEGSRSGFDLLATVHGRTDAEGVVRLPFPRTGRAWVSANARGHGPDGCEPPPSAEEVVLRLTPPGGISGRVVTAADGRPATGVRVTAGFLRSRDPRPVDSEGRFRFDDVPSGTWRVSASGGGLACSVGDEDVAGVKVEVRPGTVAEVEIPVGPAAVVEGRVLGPDGSPAAGAEVWLRHDHVAWRHERLGGITARTDAAGRFRLENVPRRPSPSWVDVCARAPGTGVGAVDLAGTWDALAYRGAPGAWTQADGLGMVFPSPEVAGPVEIRLPRAGGLVLAVQDVDSGLPVYGVAVLVGSPVPEFEGVTDERGEVLAEGLSPQTHAVGLGGDTYVAAEESPTVAVESGTVGRATLRVRRTCEIGATLVWLDGTPVHDAPMRLEVKGRNGTTHYWTDISGSLPRRRLPWDTYDVEISAGTMDSVVTGPDGQPIVYARVALEPGTTDAVIRLNRAPIPSLRLTILDAEGRSVPEGRVRHELRTVREEIESGLVAYEGARIQDGAVELRGIDRAVWLEVLAEPGPGPTGARTRLGPVLPGTGELTIRLPPALEIAGRVQSPEGEPLAEISVEAWVETAEEPEAWRDRPFAETRTGPDGTFRLDRLPAGPYTLFARVRKGFAPAPEVVVPAGRSDVVLTLVRRVDVPVTVLLPDGTPTSNATVQAFVPPWFGGEGAARGSCGPDGKTVLRDLDPRTTYLLEVTNRRPVDQERVLRFPGWSPEATTVRIPERTRLRVEVVDDAGEAVPYANVVLRSLESAQGDGAVVVHDERGQPVLLDPPPGPWVLVASDATRMSSPLRVEAGAREARVVLPRAGGRVVVEVEGGIAPWVANAADTGSQPGWVLWDEGEPGGRRQGGLLGEGRVEVDGLRPERTYACLIRDPRPDGFVAFATGLVPGGPTRRAPRLPHRRLPVRVTEPPGVWVTQVGVEETGEAAQRAEGGVFWLPAFPPGNFTVWAAGDRSEDRAEVRVRVPFDGVDAPEIVLPAR